ncbi:hypothetical protein BJX76DRAFT_319463 [Aspergillus varians]
MCVNILGTLHFLCGHTGRYWEGKAKTGCWFGCRTIIGEVIGQGCQSVSRPCSNCMSTGAFYKRGTRYYRRPT